MLLCFFWRNKKLQCINKNWINFKISQECGHLLKKKFQVGGGGGRQLKRVIFVVKNFFFWKSIAHWQEIKYLSVKKKKKPRYAAVVFSWYHGKISREEAEALLNDFREEGDFLVRDSVHFQGDYTLSIYFEGMVDHYRIIAKHNKLEVDGGDCLFDNLIQLVEVLPLSLVLLS